MNEIISVLFGVGVCCLIPIMSFATGIYYARFGLPVTLRWKGWGNSDTDEEIE